MVIILSVPAASASPGQQPTAPPGPAPHNDSTQNQIHSTLELRPIRDPTPLFTDWLDPRRYSARVCLLYWLCQQHKEQHWKKLTCSEKTEGGLGEALRVGPFLSEEKRNPLGEDVRSSQQEQH
ncbi:hypothetical protein XENOCAPTIV_009117 [Xenoophorus captivus]|uniref:Uncharacterized protein n=2 Tax=Goodeidae TaxID=28758 RepID=A0ABV0Q8X7_9TELE